MKREEAKETIINYALGMKINDGINTMENLVDKIFDEHEAQIKAKDERIKELDEALKPKTCVGCSSLILGVNSCGSTVDCKKGFKCTRIFKDEWKNKNEKF